LSTALLELTLTEEERYTKRLELEKPVPDALLAWAAKIATPAPSARDLSTTFTH